MGGFRIHDSYWRTVIDAKGTTHAIQIWRVCCTNRECGITHACLYDFLIPYRRYTAEAVSECVEKYLTRLISYVEAAFGCGRAMPDPSLVFRWLSAMLRQVDWLLQQMQLACVDTGMDLLADSEAPERCPNGVKARSERKQRELDRGARLVQLARELSLRPVLYIHHFFLSAAEIYIACLSGRSKPRICGRISSSHSLQCALF